MLKRSIRSQWQPFETDGFQKTIIFALSDQWVHLLSIAQRVVVIVDQECYRSTLSVNDSIYLLYHKYFTLPMWGSTLDVRICRLWSSEYNRVYDTFAVIHFFSLLFPFQMHTSFEVILITMRFCTRCLLGSAYVWWRGPPRMLSLN